MIIWGGGDLTQLAGLPHINCKCADNGKEKNSNYSCSTSCFCPTAEPLTSDNTTASTAFILEEYSGSVSVIKTHSYVECEAL